MKIKTLTVQMGDIEALQSSLEDGGNPSDDVFGIKMIVVGDNLNLRSEPSISGDLLLTIPRGAAVWGNGESHEADGFVWYQIKYNDTIGWSAGDWLEAPHEPPPGEHVMNVIVTATIVRVECIKGHDVSCTDIDEAPPGKPIIEPWDTVIRYNHNDVLQVVADGIRYSCKDNGQTATIKASGSNDDGTPRMYYKIPAGQPGCDARFGRYPSGGWIDASKVSLAE